jgi:hypothetical protein
MRSWVASLTRERLLDVALALALGTALVRLAEELADTLVSVLSQHLGRSPYEGDDTILGLIDPRTAPYYLNFSLGGTVIAYGFVLSGLLVLGLLGLAAVAVIRQRDRMLGVCPFCASRIPHESRHCAYCGSSLAPSEP